MKESVSMSQIQDGNDNTNNENSVQSKTAGKGKKIIKYLFFLPGSNVYVFVARLAHNLFLCSYWDIRGISTVHRHETFFRIGQ